MRKADLQQQVALNPDFIGAIELIKQLSTEKLKAGVDYLNYLQDKEAWKATHELTGNPERAENLESKPTNKNPIVGRIIEAVEKSQDVTLEDAEVLLQVIKENQMSVRFDSPFVPNEPES